MRGSSGVFTQQEYFETADFTALGTFTAEAGLLQGQNRQPVIPRDYFDRQGAGVLIRAWGVVGSTGTPTYTFHNRLNAAVGATDVSGTEVGLSAAITTGNGITNEIWELALWLSCRTPGQGTNNTTLNCVGRIMCGGFASPFQYGLAPTAPPVSTWTATVDNTVPLYPNLSVACSASNASNAIRCKKYNVHLFH